MNKLSNNIPVGEAISLSLSKNLIFAAYRIPNQEHIDFILQKSDTLNYLSESLDYYKLSGFLVSPFIDSENCPTFIIKPDIQAKDFLTVQQAESIQQLSSIPVLSDETHTPDEVSHPQYIKQLNKIISHIESGNFEKVVLSRVKIVKGSFIKQLPEIFLKLCKSYLNAFVYIFNAGPHLWIGATPEPLLKAVNGSMQTVSLAGTRPFNKVNTNIGAWNSKERLEQEYVTRYIAKVLSQFNVKDVELEGPYTKQAGNLLHLRTDFTFNSTDIKEKLGQFLSALHPTPAVCGMPRKESLELLKKLEIHQREYYSGFLGPMGINNRLWLFVNLRCMKVLGDRLALFVGSGITADSVPEDEWLETEIKAETLLSVIRQIAQQYA